MSDLIDTARNIIHVSERSRPDLDWRFHPQAIYLPFEVIQSDAFRELSKIETDLLLFVYTRRKYPWGKKKMKKKAGKMDYWNPLNGREMTIPYVAIKEFFDSPGMMKDKAPSESTISRAIKKLMVVGFISLVYLGGSGKGDTSKYRLEHNWRIWRKGDPPCFTKAGMSRNKGFCRPGSGVFNPSRNAAKN